MYLFNPYNNPRGKYNYYLNIIDEAISKDTGSKIFVFSHYTLLPLKSLFSNFTYISNELGYLVFQDITDKRANQKT